jgi:hypothetical protein
MGNQQLRRYSDNYSFSSSFRRLFPFFVIPTTKEEESPDKNDLIPIYRKGRLIPGSSLSRASFGMTMGCAGWATSNSAVTPTTIPFLRRSGDFSLLPRESFRAGVFERIFSTRALFFDCLH